MQAILRSSGDRRESRRPWQVYRRSCCRNVAWRSGRGINGVPIASQTFSPAPGQRAISVAEFTYVARKVAVQLPRTEGVSLTHLVGAADEALRDTPVSEHPTPYGIRHQQLAARAARLFDRTSRSSVPRRCADPTDEG